MRKQRTIHFDAHAASSNMLSSSLCGFVGVATTFQASEATCRLCRARMRTGRGARESPRPFIYGLPGTHEVARELHIAIGALPSPLAPHAGFPPSITPELWARSCKGGEHRRCGECEICLWEREAQLWSAVAPWTDRGHALERPEGTPRWGSLGAALCALVEHERTGRSLSSTLGGALARAARGERGEVHRDPRKLLSRPVERALDVVHVQAAIERAYGDTSGPLAPAECMRLLLERTGGVLAGVTTYEALSERYSVGEDVLKSIVRLGRERITGELVERGLIPPTRTRGRSRADSPTTYRDTSAWADDAATLAPNVGA